MQITGSQAISMPPQDVWAALNDPEILGRCVPGCESVERVSDGSFKLVMVSSIGPLRARFNGMLQMTEVQPAQSCVLLFEGQGGAIGFGKGRAEVQLLEQQGHTELRYAAEAQECRRRHHRGVRQHRDAAAESIPCPNAISVVAGNRGSCRAVSQ
jgi:carbon monoxide dehydrogenase subunit G